MFKRSSQIPSEFKEISSNENVSICHFAKKDYHHEDIPAFKERFIEDLKKIEDSFSANPLEGDSFAPFNNTSEFSII